MNSVVLVGRLTRDPELRYAPGTQTAVTRFTLAVNRPFAKNGEADFIGIVVFGKQAENCNQYLAKGAMAGVQGRIQTGSYEKDGRKIYTTDVVADRVEFFPRSMGSNSSSNGERNTYQNNGGGSNYNAGANFGTNQGSGIPDGFHAFDDDDDENIPF